MATWARYKPFYFLYNDDVNSDLQLCSIKLEYDVDTANSENLTIRFVLSGYDGYSTDSCHILFNPVDEETPGQLLLLKESGETDYPYYSSSITLHKQLDAEFFTLPAFWVCNNGNNVITNTASDYFKAYQSEGKRAEYVHRINSSTIKINTVQITDITPGDIYIVDNYNNTFSISCTKSINNEVYSQILSWGYTNKCANTITADALSNQPLTLGKSSSETRKVYAKAVIKGPQGPLAEVKAEAAIKQYIAPSSPSVPKITPDSLINGKLDPAKKWTFTWEAAPAINETSKVVGYRIRLYKNNTPIDIYNNQGEIVSISSARDKFYDSDTPDTKFTISPSNYNFVTGDAIMIKIEAYTRYGKNNDGDILISPAAQTSNKFQVSKVSPIKVNIGNGRWANATVFAKNLTGWHEATALYIKPENNEWFDGKLGKEWADTGYTK